MRTTIAILSVLYASASAFAPALPTVARPATSLPAVIAEGVEFDKVAREWRCKWSPDDDKKSLVELQKALDSIADDVKKIDGVVEVERIVCGGCLDFKVITTLEADKFGDWEAKEFAPEAAFLDKLKSIDGVSLIETQTFTKMPV